jgi:geranylgeranyl reductase family protein
VIDVDVAVVGAGPAGAAAATVLARAGRRVALVDKDAFPRDKCCGDGLTTAALHELEGLGLEPARVASWAPAATVRVHAPSGREVPFPFPERSRAGLFGAVAKRIDLDAALVDVAVAAGARLVEGAACVATRPDGGDEGGGDAVELELADGTAVRAAHVVAADGMWSPVRHQLGLSPQGYRGEAHAVRQYFADVGPAARTELHVWFEPDVLPGYAWSFPLPDGRANVGLGIHRGGPYRVGDLKLLWPEVLRRPRIRAVLGDAARPDGALKAWPLPARVDRAVLASGRVLFVGDAAGATDPLTGEGIGQALATGRWAAEAILAAGPDRPDVAAARYRDAVGRSLVADHRVSRALMPLLARPAVASALVGAAGLTPTTRQAFARWLFEDEPRAALVDPRRWRRGFLRSPGAYRAG